MGESFSEGDACRKGAKP